MESISLRKNPGFVIALKKDYKEIILPQGGILYFLNINHLILRRICSVKIYNKSVNTNDPHFLIRRVPSHWFNTYALLPHSRLKSKAYARS